jgi:tRNA(fMet)-specific endonuclease VapC
VSFLLDTNILSAHLRRPSGLAHRFFQYSGRLYTSSIALAELLVWARNRPDPTRILTTIDQLLHDEVRALDFDRDCADEFARIRVQLRRHGVEVSTTDLLIASVAVVYDLTLVTHNVGDFRNVPDLRVEDWLTP